MRHLNVLTETGFHCLGILIKYYKKDLLGGKMFNFFVRVLYGSASHMKSPFPAPSSESSETC